MESLQVESQTNQAPLPSDGQQAAQGELAKAQGFFDDANHWLDGTLAETVDGFANLGLELVRHLHLGTGIIRRGSGTGGEALAPTGMMTIASGGNIGVDPPSV